MTGKDSLLVLIPRLSNVRTQRGVTDVVDRVVVEVYVVRLEARSVLPRSWSSANDSDVPSRERIHTPDLKRVSP